MSELRNNYNRMYLENESLFGEEPAKVVGDIIKYRNSGTVMDLGAGQGRNSLYLASKGFEVHARDIADEGVEKIKRLSQEKSLTVDAQVGNMRDVSAEEKFDVFVLSNVLHHLPREAALEVLAKIKRATNPGGMNAVNTFTTESDFYKNNPRRGMFFLEGEELKEIYKDWEILEYDEVEGKALANNPDGSPIINRIVRMLARKK